MQRKTRAQQRAEEIDISPTALLATIEQLSGERDAALGEREEFLLALQRERAEFTNYKRRTAEERQAMIGLAGESLINKVLAVADDFDRAIDSRPSTIADDPWVEGIAAIDRKLRQLLESEGVSAIETEPGIAVRSPRARGRRGHPRHGVPRRRRRHGSSTRLPTP